MQRVTPPAAGRTIVFLMLACAAMLSSSGRQAKAADGDMRVDDAARRCAALGAMKVPASAFALPIGSAVVTEALLIAPDSTTPEYCRVRATIAAAQTSDPSILYQVNLPSRWNFKTVLYGGSGLNGVLVEATGAFKGGDGLTSALARGYVTYGSDSGHQTPGDSFYQNAQAAANYSHEAVKRTKDLTTAFAEVYYGKAARRNYQIGGSKGGQEGLQAVQRYYADFDGVVSYYPAAQSQSLGLAWNRLWHYAFNTPGGMRKLLEEEGIDFSPEGRVDLKRYGWDPSRDLSEEELKAILDNATAEHYEASTHLLGLLQDDAASPMRPS